MKRKNRTYQKRGASTLNKLSLFQKNDGRFSKECPLSVKNAILRFNSLKKEKFKKYLVLGDMLELGQKSRKYHEEISKVINNSDIDKVFVKGKQTIFTFKSLNKNKRGNILQNIEDIDLNLRSIISNNDYLMIKGSNSTGLHKMTNNLKERYQYVVWTIN